MGNRVVRRKILSCCAGLGLCLACTSPPRAGHSREVAIPTPVPTAVAVAQGESIETAVVVPEKTEPEGVDWENDWIWRHYGKFRKKNVGLATLSGRRFDVVTVELADRSERTVYFDITNFFGKK